MKSLKSNGSIVDAPPKSSAARADDSAVMFYKQAFGGAWMTQAIGVAAELGIADLLADEPQTATELASQTWTNADALYRMLRALASVGVFSENDHGQFSLTPLSQLLRSDVPNSQRAFATMMSAELHEAWAELSHSVKTGEPGFNKRMGRPIFEYLVTNPDRHAIFDAAMTGIHDAETEPVIQAYDWSSIQRIADVGGGNGLSLATLLHRHPHLEGTVFEMPAVAERARQTIIDAGLSGRCDVVEGDFFRAVPEADAYLLRHIVHDWDDKAATTILHNCADAMAPGGRVLVIESVIPPRNEPHFGKWLDLMMLLIGGRERTAAQYGKLFSAAGLKLNRIIPTNSDVSIIEGVLAR